MIKHLKTTLQTKLSAMGQAVRKAFRKNAPHAAAGTQAGAEDLGDQGLAPNHVSALRPPLATSLVPALLRTGKLVIVLAAIGGMGFGLYRHPPVHSIEAGEIGIRTNQLSGGVSQWHEGSVIVLPLLHELRRYSLRDQTWRAEAMSKADGSAPLQSVEGLSLGLDLSVRYALDPAKLAQLPRSDAADIQSEVVEPAVQGIVYRTLARYTVREIFSSKRPEILQLIEGELRTKLAIEGLLLRTVYIGKVDLPADYRRGMDTLIAEELATQKMRYTLELKDKRVREIELDAEAEKVRREKLAEAAAREQIIAARGQEEAMKHVLPFKQRQIEQRQLEAEAEKVSAIRRAEGSAQARRVEASGEADSRLKLADAEAYRIEKVGKSNSEQMAREGALITRHPLLIQKAMADKLSDKIQVIIAPPSTGGNFIGSGLIGNLNVAKKTEATDSESTQGTERSGQERAD